MQGLSLLPQEDRAKEQPFLSPKITQPKQNDRPISIQAEFARIEHNLEDLNVPAESDFTPATSRADLWFFCLWAPLAATTVLTLALPPRSPYLPWLAGLAFGSGAGIAARKKIARAFRAAAQWVRTRSPSKEPRPGQAKLHPGFIPTAQKNPAP